MATPIKQKEFAMKPNTAPQPNEAEHSVAFADPSPRRLFTLPKFAERHRSFLTLPALTNQVFKARSRESTKGVIPGNGMLDHGAIVRINGRVLVDEAGYFRWLDAKQSSPEDRAPREQPREREAKPAARHKMRSRVAT
jgi:hypothetical protein